MRGRAAHAARHTRLLGWGLITLALALALALTLTVALTLTLTLTLALALTLTLTLTLNPKLGEYTPSYCRLEQLWIEAYAAMIGAMVAQASWLELGLVRVRVGDLANIISAMVAQASSP